MVLRYQLLFSLILETGNSAEEQIGDRNLCFPGHTYFTHSYLLKREEQPECIPYQCPLCVWHILVECIDSAPIRSQYFEAESLKELFENHQSILTVRCLYQQYFIPTFMTVCVKAHKLILDWRLFYLSVLICMLLSSEVFSIIWMF